jgi:hypothetical protein
MWGIFVRGFEGKGGEMEDYYWDRDCVSRTKYSKVKV